MKRQPRRKKSVKEKSMTLKQIKKLLTTLKRGTPIEIRWTDAYSGNSWRDFDDSCKGAYRVSTIGYFAMSDHEYVRMYSADVLESENSTVGSVSGIPLMMITRIKKL